MKNRVAVITGATAGIGKATAFELAKNNIDLILTGRRQERLDSLKKELSKYVQVTTLCFDLQNKEQVEKIINDNKSLLSKVDILINNAGLAKGVDPVNKADIDHWEQMIDTNIKGLLYITRHMLPFLLAKESADLINIGSVSGRWVYPGGAVYCGTKHAVRAISEGIRMDLNGSNVKVSCIEPGLCETEFSQVRLEDTAKAEDVYKGLKALSPEDIAQTISWVLARPGHVNIQEMVIYPTAQAHVTQVARN